MKCLYHAVKMWVSRGGYLCIRKSRFCSWIPHFIWAKGVVDGEHWQPDEPVKGWLVLIDMWIAKGKVKKGD